MFSQEKKSEEAKSSLSQTPESPSEIFNYQNLDQVTAAVNQYCIDAEKDLHDRRVIFQTLAYLNNLALYAKDDKEIEKAREQTDSIAKTILKATQKTPNKRSTTAYFYQQINKLRCWIELSREKPDLSLVQNYYALITSSSVDANVSRLLLETQQIENTIRFLKEINRFLNIKNKTVNHAILLVNLQVEKIDLRLAPTKMACNLLCQQLHLAKTPDELDTFEKRNKYINQKTDDAIIELRQFIEKNPMLPPTARKNFNQYIQNSITAYENYLAILCKKIDLSPHMSLEQINVLRKTAEETLQKLKLKIITNNKNKISQAYLIEGEVYQTFFNKTDNPKDKTSMLAAIKQASDELKLPQLHALKEKAATLPLRNRTQDKAKTIDFYIEKSLIPDLYSLINVLSHRIGIPLEVISSVIDTLFDIQEFIFEVAAVAYQKKYYIYAFSLYTHIHLHSHDIWVKYKNSGGGESIEHLICRQMLQALKAGIKCLLQQKRNSLAKTDFTKLENLQAKGFITFQELKEFDTELQHEFGCQSFLIPVAQPVAKIASEPGIIVENNKSHAVEKEKTPTKESSEQPSSQNKIIEINTEQQLKFEKDAKDHSTVEDKSHAAEKEKASTKEPTEQSSSGTKKIEITAEQQLKIENGKKEYSEATKFYKKKEWEKAAEYDKKALQEWKLPAHCVAPIAKDKIIAAYRLADWLAVSEKWHEALDRINFAINLTVKFKIAPTTTINIEKFNKLKKIIEINIEKKSQKTSTIKTEDAHELDVPEDKSTPDVDPYLIQWLAEDAEKNKSEEALASQMLSDADAIERKEINAQKKAAKKETKAERAKRIKAIEEQLVREPEERARREATTKANIKALMEKYQSKNKNEKEEKKEIHSEPLLKTALGKTPVDKLQLLFKIISVKRLNDFFEFSFRMKPRKTMPYIKGSLVSAIIGIFVSPDPIAAAETVINDHDLVLKTKHTEEEPIFQGKNLSAILSEETIDNKKLKCIKKEKNYGNYGLISDEKSSTELPIEVSIEYKDYDKLNYILPTEKLMYFAESEKDKKSEEDLCIQYQPGRFIIIPDDNDQFFQNIQKNILAFNRSANAEDSRCTFYLSRAFHTVRKFPHMQPSLIAEVVTTSLPWVVHYISRKIANHTEDFVMDMMRIGKDSTVHQESFDFVLKCYFRALLLYHAQRSAFYNVAKVVTRENNETDEEIVLSEMEVGTGILDECKKYGFDTKADQMASIVYHFISRSFLDLKKTDVHILKKATHFAKDTLLSRMNTTDSSAINHVESEIEYLISAYKEHQRMRVSAQVLEQTSIYADKPSGTIPDSNNRLSNKISAFSKNKS